MTKTPGQIAYEAQRSSKAIDNPGFLQSMKWHQLDDWDRSHWESAAQAVRAPLEHQIELIQSVLGTEEEGSQGIGIGSPIFHREETTRRHRPSNRDEAMNKTELLPCPFCGSNKIERKFENPHPFVRCGECGATGPKRLLLCLADDSWNRRTPTIPEVHAAREANEEAQV